MLNSGEIIALSCTVHPPAIGIEPRDRARQPDFVDECEDNIGGRGATSHHLLQHLDIGCELDNPFRITLLVETTCQLVEIDDAPLFSDPVGYSRMERTRRSPERLANVDGVEPSRRAAARETNPGQHRAYGGPVGKLQPYTATHRYASGRQGDLDWRKKCIYPRENRYIGGGSSCGDRRFDGTACGSNGINGRIHRPSGWISRCRSDGFRNPSVVVPKEPIYNVNDSCWTAIVHFKRVLPGTRKEASKIDQPRRVSAVVPVDRLVIVTNTEHCSTRR